MSYLERKLLQHNRKVFYNKQVELRKQDEPKDPPIERVIFDLKGVPVMAMDCYTNFYWVVKSHTGKYKFIDIPFYKNETDVAI